MVDEIVNDNIIIVNAPAGSGKTYRIKAELNKFIIENPQDKVLCITYTNRAANELLKDIDSHNIYVSTIHSYINGMISPILGKKEVIDLYFEKYGDKIEQRICNPEKQESNNKYIERYGRLNLETIKLNIKKLSYNETQFNSLYYGGLSHDDLLTFTSLILEKYPKLYQKINRKFKLIIIDEYQDTSPEVLKIFINAVQGTDVKLYLYGDKMQQIYKLYNVELNKKLSLLKHDDRKIINHRSIPVIVDILNNVYNEKNLNQGYFDKLTSIQPDYSPRVIIGHTSIFPNIINEINSQDSKVLTLYIFNRKRFEQIGSGNLYKAFSKIDKYGVGKHFTVTDVLLNNDNNNPDDLLQFMIIMYKANNYWAVKNYGSFLKIYRNNKKIFNDKKLVLNYMNDKSRLASLWREVFVKFNEPDVMIGQLIELMNNKELLNPKFIETINTDNMYKDVFEVSISEIIALENSNLNPNVSTQHGVKGESHDSVIFVAEDSKSSDPRVYMYDFFKIWSLADFSLDEFEQFYFEYFSFCIKVKSPFEFDLRDIKKDQHDTYKNYLIHKSEEIVKHFADNKIFYVNYKSLYENYLSKQSCANAKKCFNENVVANVLSAYKLFYVGCSRARKNLTVLVDESKLDGFKDNFINKVISVGFEVIDKSNAI